MSVLEGRVALVTGAARGIGCAIATRLAEEGASIVVNDLDHDAAVALADELATKGIEVRSVGGSVAERAATDAMVAVAEEAFGTLDILVNNAGITRDGMVHRMSDDAWDLVNDTILRGAFNACRSAARLLRPPAGHHRKVVNIASINGIHGTAGNVNYSAAKAGLIGLTKSLAREWAPLAVNVNAVAPGFIEGTRLTSPRAESDALGIPGPVVERIIQAIPIGRAGRPQDVAAATAFLCSTDADYITGQCLEVHGGLEIINVV